MELNRIFLNPVSRPIEGVIKADDESSLHNELSEYVLTNEVAKRLEHFLDAYNDYHSANGVWVSGFFGSGKSHLLKMLAVLLENREVGGEQALEIFLAKIPMGDELLRASLKRAIAIPSKSILFNIDQKADIISKTQVDALLSVFVKVFNEMCGYFGKQGYIAQFERDLDGRNQFDAFKDAYLRHANKAWERGREQALLEAGNIAKAYAEITGEDPALTKGILDKYRSQYSVSIEDFGNQVKAWLDKKPANFRLNFFVDEVGQYIAENTKLMTNLQTVAESLATKCQGRAWIIVTAQEDMNSVLGDLSKQQSNDFTKIQARFANRLKLTSADVAEVIQKRLLTKNEIGSKLLKETYAQQVNNFKTLFDFADGGQAYQNFRDEDHFIYAYPFVPYQFPLFQSAIRGISVHNGFEGKASSVGERSMLGVFREVAIAIDNEPVGQLATFDRMFEGIRGALKSGIQSAINTAERNLGDPYAIRVLKALFLVKYVKEFKATLRNLSVLMLERFGEDVPAQRKKLEAALNLLEQQTYIQRSGDLYEYLTDEEKDVEEEIKNTDVETADIIKELETLLFDGVIKQRKIRHSNGQDYAYTRKMDERAVSREYELAIHIITPLSDNFDNIALQRMQSMGRDELRVVLPADARFMQDLTMHKRTEKYIRQNSNTQQEAVKRILDAKGFQNTERLSDLQVRAKALLGKAALIINAADIDVNSEDGQTRVLKGFDHLIQITYPNLRMLRDLPFNEADVGKHLRMAEDGLLANDATSLTEAEQELLAFIQSNARSGVRTTVKSLIERFERKNYGWYYAAILCNLALLSARGKVEIRQDSNTLEAEALERSLRNTNAHATLVLEPQVEFTASQVRTLKEFFADFFDKPAASNEARALARETIDAIKDLEIELVELNAQQALYPFLNVLDAVLVTLKEVSEKNVNWFLTDLARAEDALLDTKEKLVDPLRRFMKSPQKAIFDQARQLVAEQEDNFAYVPATEVEIVQALLVDKSPWQGNRLQQTKPQLDALQQSIANQLASEKATAANRLDELGLRLQATDEYATINPDDQARLSKPFIEAGQVLQGQKRIAMIRDQLRHFEDERYPQLLLQLEGLAKPKPVALPPNIPNDTTPPVEGGKPQATAPTSVVAEPRLVPARTIKIGYPKPWLANEAELDEYLKQQREAWLKEIQAGNRVQV
ncbi:BREX system P-loop protein BrxC [Undibacterium sp. LX40W]|uniref:BREX system P-loop protein BrxC n=1 Tax=Undibacterium nitidum TaxID=2762298 RepID=A0A923HKY4_9BURK|nr:MULTISPECIES: BREX system P-loop protein BrxC [Undibacterium]MBC3881560.1 BREX system P-loop protein BrxC [Undibacterium nitidum]MBC3891658.1 BREX system P-loop protein BrxC [Undibacterium sp. LX40W]